MKEEMKTSTRIRLVSYRQELPVAFDEGFDYVSSALCFVVRLDLWINCCKLPYFCKTVNDLILLCPTTILFLGLWRMA